EPDVPARPSRGLPSGDHRQLFAPDRQLVAVGIGKVEAFTAGKLKDFADDLSARFLHLAVGVIERSRVEDDQHAARLCAIGARRLGLAVEAAGEPAVVETGVSRAPILEFPTKNLVVEALGRLNVGCRKFDVVHLEVVLLLAHSPSFRYCEVRRMEISTTGFQPSASGIKRTELPRKSPQSPPIEAHGTPAKGAGSPRLLT